MTAAPATSAAAAIALKQMNEPERVGGFQWFGTITSYTITEEMGNYGATSRVYMEIEAIGQNWPVKVDAFTWTKKWKKAIGPKFIELGLLPATDEEAQTFDPDAFIGMPLSGERISSVSIEGDKGYYEPKDAQGNVLYERTTHIKDRGKFVKVEKGSGTHCERYIAMPMVRYASEEELNDAYLEYCEMMGIDPNGNEDAGDSTTVPAAAPAPAAVAAAPARKSPPQVRNVPQRVSDADFAPPAPKAAPAAKPAAPVALTENAAKVLSAVWLRAGGTDEKAANLDQMQDLVNKHPVLKQMGLTYASQPVQDWVTEKSLPF